MNSEDEEEIVNSLKEEIQTLNKECANLRVKLAAATCDALEKALAKIDELQTQLDEMGATDEFATEDFSYSVEWHEEWGMDAIHCGEDLNKAKKIFEGKAAEGKAVMLEHSITRYLKDDDEDEDS